MTESNTSNSVRDRINAIVDAREKREVANVPVVEKVEKIAGPQEIEGPKKEKKNRLPIILGSVFGVVVVGLVVAIVVVVLKPWEDKTTEEIIANNDNMSIEATTQRLERRNAAMQECNDIKNDYGSGNIDYATAVNSFDSKMLSSDPVWDIYYAICYANFIYDNTEDSYDGIEVLNKVESQLDEVNNNIATDYYVALGLFYGYANDEEKVIYYNSIVNNLLNEGADNNVEDLGEEE